MAAPKILDDLGSMLQVESADGTSYHVPRRTYETLYGAVPSKEPEDAVVTEDTVAPEKTPDPINPAVRNDLLLTKDDPTAAPDTMAPSPGNTGPTPAHPAPGPATPSRHVPPPVDGELPGSPGYNPPEPPPTTQGTPGADSGPATDAPDEPPPVSGDTSTVEDYNRSIREYQRDKEAANNRLADIDAKDADAIARALDKQDRDATEIEKQRQAAYDEAVAEGEAKLNKYQAMVNDYASADVDQGHWWDSKSTGTKILAGISVALSGLGMAFKHRGGENPALDMITAAIDKDINLQLQKIDRMGKAAGMQKGLLAEFWKHVDRKDTAYTLAKATAYEQTARKIEIIGAKSQSERIRQNAAIAAAELRKDAAKALEGAREQVKKEAIERYNAKTTRMQHYWQHKDKNRQLDIMEDQNRYAREHSGNAPAPGYDASNPNVVLDENGHPVGHFRGDDKTARREFEDRRRARARWARDLNEMKKLSYECGANWDGPWSNKFLESDCAQKIKTRYETSFAAYRKSMTGAQASEKEMEALQKAYRPPETWTSSNPVASWDEQLRMTWEAEDEDMHFNTYQPDGSVYTSARERWESPSRKDDFIKQINDEYVDTLRQHEAPPGIDPEKNHEARKAAAVEFYETNKNNKGVWEESSRDVRNDQFKITLELSQQKNAALRDAGVPIKAGKTQQIAEIKKARAEGKIDAATADELIAITEQHARELEITQIMAGQYGPYKTNKDKREAKEKRKEKDRFQGAWGGRGY